MHVRLLLVCLCLLCPSLAARADILFTYVAGADTITGTLPSSPSMYNPNGYTEFDNLSAELNGSSTTLSYIAFYDSYFSTHDIGFGWTVVLEVLGGSTYFSIGDQVYTVGTEASPQFLTGSYPLTGWNGTGNGSLTLADSSAATPEPGSLMLAGTGILATVGAVRRRFLSA